MSERVFGVYVFDISFLFELPVFCAASDFCVVYHAKHRGLLFFASYCKFHAYFDIVAGEMPKGIRSLARG